MVQAECQRWAGKGINIKYEVRPNRVGYKAGALREGMKRSYVRLCDYVAIFDADFQPESDFLNRTIPYLVHNADVGLVQARWKFGMSSAARFSLCHHELLDITRVRLLLLSLLNRAPRHDHGPSPCPSPSPP